MGPKLPVTKQDAMLVFFHFITQKGLHRRCTTEDRHVCLAGAASFVALINRGLCALRGPYPMPQRDYREEDSRSSLRASSPPPSPLLPSGNDVNSARAGRTPLSSGAHPPPGLGTTYSSVLHCYHWAATLGPTDHHPYPCPATCWADKGLLVL